MNFIFGYTELPSVDIGVHFVTICVIDSLFVLLGILACTQSLKVLVSLHDEHILLANTSFKVLEQAIGNIFVSRNLFGNVVTRDGVGGAVGVRIFLFLPLDKAVFV